MATMQLPLMLPKELTYCESANEDDALYNLLLKNTSDLVLFVETACADLTWSSKHRDFMAKALSWLTIQFFQDRLAMEYAKRVSSAIRTHFYDMNPYVLLNILIKLKDKDLPINSLLYGSCSQPLRELIRRECRDMQRMLFKLPDASSLYFESIDTYINKGETEEIHRKEKETVIQVLNQSLRWELYELAEACEEFLKKYITQANMVEMLLEAHQKGWQGLRQGCFDYINNLKMGVRFLPREKDRFAFEFLEFNDAALGLFEKVRPFITDLVCGQDLAEEEQFAKVIQKCPKMLCLDLGHSDGYTDGMKQIPRLLQELSLPACPWLDDEALSALIQTCPNVRKLTLTSDSKIGPQGWGKLQKLVQLRELDVTRCGQIGDDEMKLILNACGGLVNFSMEDCRGVSDKGFLEIPKLNPRLTHLNLARCNINDTALVELISKCNKLTTLNLTRCEEITERSILGLIGSAPSLRLLNLTHCNIPSGVCQDLKSKRPYVEVLFD